MQKHVNLVDLVKSFPTNIYLQNLASIQKRTSPVKFAHLAEKSGKGSISNLSTKAKIPARGPTAPQRQPPLEVHGNLEVTRAFVVPSEAPWPKEAWGVPLGIRVNQIRSQEHYVKDEPERRAELDEIGFRW